MHHTGTTQITTPLTSVLLILAATACTTSPPPARYQPTASPPASAASPASPPPNRTQEPADMTIRLTVGSTTLNAVLNDNPTARDLLTQLPLTLPLKNHGDKEKIAYPPRRLSTDSAPAAATGRTGDLAYYAPWGNLVIYYHDRPQADDGLIILGHLTSPTTGLSTLAGELTIARTP
jgi:hypothetical protein